MAVRYRAQNLINFASQLLVRSGVEAEKAETAAEILVEGDLLGHTTHGLQLLPSYLQDAEKGSLTKTGSPRIIADFPAAVTWDGMRLPGTWLTATAVDLAAERAKKYGTCTVVIRRSHHIACLASYLKRVTDQKMMIILTCSDPNAAGVTPHGGRREVYTPNPIAAAWPTSGDPVMMDVSQSITTHGMVRRCHAEKKKLPGPWLVDSDGHPTDDPATMFKEPKGSLLPVGGVDHGHKGYALGLLVEALTSGLGGHGRADPREGWSANVYIQVFDPALYGGADELVRQMDWLSDACHQTPPREGFERVRLPGETGLRRRERQLVEGVELYPTIMPALKPWAEKLGVPLPV